MKIIVTSHGSLCEGILESYQMIAGKTDEIISIKLDNDGINKFSKKLHETVEKLIQKEDILIYCDIKGGTPYNESFSLKLKYPNKIQVVTGLNLPMLIETGLTLSMFDNAESLAITAQKVGSESIERIIISDEKEDDLEF